MLNRTLLTTVLAFCGALALSVQAQTGIQVRPSGLGLKPLPSRISPIGEPRPTQPEPERMGAIFRCVAAGLPKGWKRAWVRVEQKAGTRGKEAFVAKSTFSRDAAASAGAAFKTCDAKKMATSIYELNEFLPTREKKQWKSATLEFTDEGTFSVSYGYGK